MHTIRVTSNFLDDLRRYDAKTLRERGYDPMSVADAIRAADATPKTPPAVEAPPA
jgi:hypothetical protein